MAQVNGKDEGDMASASNSDDEGDTFMASELGTKEFWDSRYQLELSNYNDHYDEGEVWFGKNAEKRIMRHFLYSYVPKTARIIDLGSGNGSLLRRLRRTGYRNLVGVDYCASAVALAKRIDEHVMHQVNDHVPIRYEEMNLCASLPPHMRGAFDICVDKGTLDAISLSTDRNENLRAYLSNVEALFAPPPHDDWRRFIICSCNFAQNELVGMVESLSEHLRFTYAVAPPSQFTFSGVTGTTSVVCVFRISQLDNNQP